MGDGPPHGPETVRVTEQGAPPDDVKATTAANFWRMAVLLPRGSDAGGRDGGRGIICLYSTLQSG